MIFTEFKGVPNLGCLKSQIPSLGGSSNYMSGAKCCGSQVTIFVREGRAIGWHVGPFFAAVSQEIRRHEFISRNIRRGRGWFPSRKNVYSPSSENYGIFFTPQLHSFVVCYSTQQLSLNNLRYSLVHILLYFYTIYIIYYIYPRSLSTGYRRA